MKRRFTVQMFILIALLLVPSLSQAGMIVNLGTLINDPDKFFAEITWTAPAGGASSESKDVDGNPVPHNWDVSLLYLTTPLPKVLVTITQHLIGPHPDDVNPNPQQITLAIPLISPGDPGTSSASGFVLHPTTGGANHLDTASMTVTQIDPTTSLVTIQAMHTIPEPSAMALAAFGVGLLIVGRRRFQR